MGTCGVKRVDTAHSRNDMHSRYRAPFAGRKTPQTGRLMEKLSDCHIWSMPSRVGEKPNEVSIALKLAENSAPSAESNAQSAPHAYASERYYSRI